MKQSKSFGELTQESSSTNSFWHRVFHSSLLCGCLIGALIGTGVPLAAATAPATTVIAAAMAAPASESTDPAVDLNSFWQSTHQTVFGVPLIEAMPTFQLKSAVSKSNWLKYHKGFNELGGIFGLELVQFHHVEKELDVLTVEQRASITTAGMVSAYVMGVFHGTNESETPFHGLYLSVLAQGGQRVHHLIPLGAVSVETIKAVTEANAISASTQPGSMTPRETCQFMAKAKYKNCMSDAELARNTCLAGALAVFIGAAAVCAGGVLLPVIGWGLGTACYLTALAAYYAAELICKMIYDDSIFTCQTTMTLKMQQCIVDHPQP